MILNLFMKIVADSTKFERKIVLEQLDKMINHFTIQINKH